MSAGGAVLRSPFPYFGGKSRVAAQIWERLGDPPNYIEPFFGSGAVLLGRPDANGQWIETVNDLDGWLCNAWRAMAADPDSVAQVCDWPVSELDLHARGQWLMTHRGEFTERLRTDPEYYDVRAAGWWIWGACCWIGGEWASNTSRQSPHLGTTGKGIHRMRPHLGTTGMGIHRRHDTTRRAFLEAWFHALSRRLSAVRICCGDWSRICGPSPTVKNGLTGVFLDPPYCGDRDGELYAEESVTIAHDVAIWCREHGDDGMYRIALCGYEGDYEMPGWECMSWKAPGGYGSQSQGRGRSNAGRERIWFSPHCLSARQGGLFYERR